MNKITDSSLIATKEDASLNQVKPNEDLCEVYRQTLISFSVAWGAGDVDSLLGLMSDEPVYKSSTGQGPGSVYIGRENVRAAFKNMTKSSSSVAEVTTASEPPKMYFFDDHALVFWNLMLPGEDGSPKKVDGVDIITFSGDGRIAIKDAYRKAFT